MEHKAEPKIGTYDWDRGEYLGNGIYFTTSYYPGCTYRDGDHKMYFGCFKERGCKHDVIYAGELDRWQKPYENEPVPEEKRQEILRMIQSSRQGPFIVRDGTWPGRTEPIPSAFTLLKEWFSRLRTKGLLMVGSAQTGFASAERLRSKAVRCNLGPQPGSAAAAGEWITGLNTGR